MLCFLLVSSQLVEQAKLPFDSTQLSRLRDAATLKSTAGKMMRFPSDQLAVVPHFSLLLLLRALLVLRLYIWIIASIYGALECQ